MVPKVLILVEDPADGPAHASNYFCEEDSKALIQPEVSYVNWLKE
jgi:hypothetical protein